MSDESYQYLITQVDHWRERAEKAEARIKKLEAMFVDVEEGEVWGGKVILNHMYQTQHFVSGGKCCYSKV